MEAKILDIKGNETGQTVNLTDGILTEKPNDHVIYLDVKQHLANKRQGTHQTKERSDVKGSTKKVKRQKGTGTARFGDIKNPLFRGGGRMFGPKPRYYGFKVNKKEKCLARKSALTYKFNENSVIVVEDFDFETPKTKQIIEIKKNLKIDDKKVIFVLPFKKKNVYLSARNLEKVKVLTVSELNTYNILDASKIVFTKGALETLTKNLA